MYLIVLCPLLPPVLIVAATPSLQRMQALLQPHVMQFTPTAPAVEGSSAGGPLETASSLPPLPAKRSKPPSQKSMNVVIQQILQSAVADASSAPPEEGEEGGGEGVPVEVEEEVREVREVRSAAGEDHEESGSAYSSCSSEEGEEVYVLFNEDDSAHEDASASCESSAWKEVVEVYIT